MSSRPTRTEAEHGAEVVILVVCQEASERLRELVEELRRHRYREIVVVDDGNSPEDESILEQLAPACTVLRRPDRRGKGPALRVGFHHCSLHYPHCVGVVTVDGDGRHRVEDVDRVVESLFDAPEDLVLGSRRFGREMPRMVRLGNAISRQVFRLRTGASLEDALSGLRGIPRGLLPQLHGTGGRHSEYELNVLITAALSGRRIREVPIRTVPDERGLAQRFNPLLDSFAIWFLLVRFTSSSMACAVLDTLVYALLHEAGMGLAVSVFGARALSSGVNFLLNRGFVFHSDRPVLVTAILYYSLVLVMAVLTYLGIDYLHGRLSIGVLPSKILTETVLFALSFLAQRDLIFRRSSPDAGKP